MVVHLWRQRSVSDSEGSMLASVSLKLIPVATGCAFAFHGVEIILSADLTDLDKRIMSYLKIVI